MFHFSLIAMKHGTHLGSIDPRNTIHAIFACFSLQAHSSLWTHDTRTKLNVHDHDVESKSTVLHYLRCLPLVLELPVLLEGQLHPDTEDTHTSNDWSPAATSWFQKENKWTIYVKQRINIRDYNSFTDVITLGPFQTLPSSNALHALKETRYFALW